MGAVLLLLGITTTTRLTTRILLGYSDTINIRASEVIDDGRNLNIQEYCIVPQCSPSLSSPETIGLGGLWASMFVPRPPKPPGIGHGI